MRTRGFSDSSAGKESTCNSGNPGLIPGLGRYPGEGKGNPLQYSGLENSIDYSPWSRKESDITERLSLHFTMRTRDKKTKTGNTVIRWPKSLEER